MSIFKNFIAGNWVESPGAMENINPSDTNDCVGEYGKADAALAASAINAAAEASTKWRHSNVQERFDILDRIGTEILARAEELGTLLAREEGKTRPEAIGEVNRAGQIFKYFAGEAVRIQGERLSSTRTGVDVNVTQEPLGVVGVITPWNFPIAIPAWKIAPALAFGNTIVFKPAELTPASAWALAEIIARSGLPAGVFNMLMGEGRIVGEEILSNPNVDAVTFTGSVQTGAHVASKCSARGAKYQLEMGGKNPLIVLADADMETAVNCALNGAFFSTGQRCTASSRLIVDSMIHDAFTESLADRMKSLKVGHALKEGTQIGPVVNQNQLDKNASYIKTGTQEGAELVYGGEILQLETPGYYMSPALFSSTKNEMKINREEIFGPIASVIRVDGLEAAVSVANDTPFGLSAGICTTSLKSAAYFNDHIRAGMTMVNLPTAGVDYHVPFGGTKSSSYGSREQGRQAVQFYTTTKTSYIGN